eukprot:TRINITY_DN9608_c0_g1_i1.p1 TRINITY_DN9608_c0_g1~~TRINITY_DN9608_c0_g1_i1.p1  ORF type:complete len:157 (+),score=16.94 TRINITY_DN9608_c0_g1_i1:63-533(+)
MIKYLFAFLFVLLSVGTATVTRNDEKLIIETTNQFFSELFVDCDHWVSLFAENGVFYHPTHVAPQGKEQLANFCRNTTLAFKTNPVPAYVPSNDLPLITEAGNLYSLITPYVFSAVTFDGDLFVNYGSVALMFQQDQQGFKIITALENWTRKRWIE